MQGNGFRGQQIRLGQHKGTAINGAQCGALALYPSQPLPHVGAVVGQGIETGDHKHRRDVLRLQKRALRGQQHAIGGHHGPAIGADQVPAVAVGFEVVGNAQRLQRREQAQK